MNSTRPRFAVLAILVCASHAHAALPDEIQVYADDLAAQGAYGLELHVNTTPSGRSAPDYPGEVTPNHGLRVTPEISRGIARNWDIGLYLPTTRTAGGAYDFAGPKFRLKWLPLRSPEGGQGAFAGLNGELAFVQSRFDPARRTLEIRPILGYRSAQWLFAFNPTIGVDLAGADHGVATFHPAVKLARDIGERTALGLEYYADLGRLGSPPPRSEQSHVLFLVLDAERKLGLNVGIGRGLTAASDRWTVKAIVSF